MKKLIYTKEGVTFVKNIKIFEDINDLKPALSPLAWKILETLSEKEMYPLEIAKKLEVHEQKIYYHINKLVKAGLIELSRKKEVKGALAKFYKTVFPSFGVELKWGDREIPGYSYTKVDESLQKFFTPFISNSHFDGYIVVGSPDPHGPLKSWARDGHYAIYLAMLLGSFVSAGKRDYVKLDVEIRGGNKIGENLIVIGGPGVNMISAQLNEHLPVRLLGELKGEAPKAVFGTELYSEKTRKKYKEETVGYIVKQKNPFNKKNNVIVLAGLGRRGTKAAVLAVTRFYEQVFKNQDLRNFARIVKGYDLSGRGEIDSVEILE